MPCLNLSTNVNLDCVDTSSIFTEATKVISRILGRPESYVMILLKGSVPISFNGSQEPAVFGELISIGGLNSEVNKKLRGAIGDILQSKLSVPKTRFFLKMYDTKAIRYSSKI